MDRVDVKPEMFKTFLERFSLFGDAVIRELNLILVPDPKCILHIHAMDKEVNWEWVEVDLYGSDLKEWYWSPGWRGSFECFEAKLRVFHDAVYLAVALESVQFESPEAFAADNVAAYFVVKTLAFRVHDIS